MSKENLKYWFLIVSLGFIFTNTQAQEKKLDPAGYVNKYNINFNGIGPKVYVLPAPRTEEQRLTETFQELKGFNDSINLALQVQRITENYKSTTNTEVAESKIAELNKQGNSAIESIKNHLSSNDIKLAYALQNNIAKQYLIRHNFDSTLSLLNDAFQNATTAQNKLDIINIQSNIASLLFLNKEFVKAGNLEEEYYKYVTEEKSVIDQANSLVKIALIQAYDNDFKSAEYSIIRKSIPLFNKAKDYKGKVNAWIALAEIYRMQNKHTEAQWFLIQARDLTEEKNIPNKSALIEYMLGSSKLAQENYKVSEKELATSLKLAKTEDNKYLEMAIVEQLGLVNVKLRDFPEADKLLKRYWELKSQLF